MMKIMKLSIFIIIAPLFMACVSNDFDNSKEFNKFESVKNYYDLSSKNDNRILKPFNGEKNAIIFMSNGIGNSPNGLTYDYFRYNKKNSKFIEYNFVSFIEQSYDVGSEKDYYFDLTFSEYNKAYIAAFNHFFSEKYRNDHFFVWLTVWDGYGIKDYLDSVSIFKKEKIVLNVNGPVSYCSPGIPCNAVVGELFYTIAMPKSWFNKEFNSQSKDSIELNHIKNEDFSKYRKSHPLGTLFFFVK